jgi:hypothetical protein
MNCRRRVGIIALGGMALLCVLDGCSTNQPSREPKAPSSEATLSANSLVDAAWLTYRNARAAPDMGEIPPECWADAVKALHPIKVYTHRVNIVVVQRIHDGIEEGKYIYIPISSYLPLTGDDGFEFIPNPLRGNKYTLGDGVFDFKRTIRKP